MSWPTVMLGEVAKSVDYGLTASATDRPVGPKFLRITDIQDDAVDWRSVPNCIADGAQLSRNRLADGDIVFARTGATTGKSFLVRDPPNDAVFASYLIRVRPSHRLDSAFLAHFFRSPGYWRQIERAARGAAQPGVNASILKELAVPLPTLGDQRRIAAILDRADAICRKRQLLTAYADQFLAARFLELSAKYEHELVDTDLNSIAAHGKNTFSNGPFGSDLLTSELTDMGIPVIYIRDIRNGRYARVSSVFVTKDKAEKLRACSVINGDVLIAKVGDPPGIAAVYPDGEPDAIVTQDVIRLRLNSQRAEPEYLQYLLNSEYGKHVISSITVEATRARFGLGQLKKTKFKILPVERQLEFVRVAKLAGSMRSVLVAAHEQALALKASLTQRAFCGEL